jgi:hypothetical protein
MRSFLKHRVREVRGNALILAVFLLLTMTSIGVVAVQRTNSDLLVAGNLVQATQSYLIGEAGTNHAVTLAGASPFKLFAAIRDSRGATGTGPKRANIPGMGGGLATLNKDTAMRIPVFDEAADPKVRKQQESAYTVMAIFSKDKEQGGVAGNDVNLDICFYYYDLHARGLIPKKEGTIKEMLEQTDSVIVGNRARIFVGPMKCL